MYNTSFTIMTMQTTLGYYAQKWYKWRSN